MHNFHQPVIWSLVCVLCQPEHLSSHLCINFAFIRYIAIACTKFYTCIHIMYTHSCFIYVWLQNSLSSSMMVTVAWSGFRVTHVGALERYTVNVLLFSSLLSLIIGILIVCIVAPAVKATVPLVEL